MTIKNKENISTTMLVRENLELTLEIVESEGRIDIFFYKDEKMEEPFSGKTFAFTDESFDNEINYKSK